MRAFAAEGRAYNQLLIGLAVLALTVFGSAIWLARILYLWSRQLVRLETELAGRDPGAADLPAITRTGEREFDRLVDALNATGARLADERRRASAAERLAAVGRLAAGLSHEIRNPIAAMRLKAENALAARRRRTPDIGAAINSATGGAPRWTASRPPGHDPTTGAETCGDRPCRLPRTNGGGAP